MKLTAKAAAVPPIAMDWNRPGLRATGSGMVNTVDTESQSLESGALDERTTSSLTYFLKKNKRSTHQVESGRTTVFVPYVSLRVSLARQPTTKSNLPISSRIKGRANRPLKFGS